MNRRGGCRRVGSDDCVGRAEEDHARAQLEAVVRLGALRFANQRPVCTFRLAISGSRAEQILEDDFVDHIDAAVELRQHNILSSHTIHCIDRQRGSGGIRGVVCAERQQDGVQSVRADNREHTSADPPSSKATRCIDTHRTNSMNPEVSWSLTSSRMTFK